MKTSLPRWLHVACVVLLALGASAGRGGAAENVSIAAASDLVFCLEELGRKFTNLHPTVTLKTSTGASGNFFAQIKNGAPFDVFLSADMHYPRALIQAGVAEESSLVPYAVGHLVLWTVRTNVTVTNGLASLRDPALRRIAMANPEHAPYGRAARAALQHAGLWDAVQPRLVLGENIAQTAQFVQSGNADAGIVGLSLVSSPRLKNVGRWIAVPPESHPPLEQGAVLTTRAKGNAAAREFLKFLGTKPAREIFDAYGFRLPARGEAR